MVVMNINGKIMVWVVLDIEIIRLVFLLSKFGLMYLMIWSIVIGEEGIIVVKMVVYVILNVWIFYVSLFLFFCSFGVFFCELMLIVCFCVLVLWLFKLLIL